MVSIIVGIIIFIVIFVIINVFVNKQLNKRNSDFDWQKLDKLVAEWQYWRTHNYTFPPERERKMIPTIAIYPNNGKGLTPLTILDEEEYEDFDFKCHFIA